jgi:hypothetical protein
VTVSPARGASPRPRAGARRQRRGRLAHAARAPRARVRPRGERGLEHLAFAARVQVRVGGAARSPRARERSPSSKPSSLRERARARVVRREAPVDAGTLCADAAQEASSTSVGASSRNEGCHDFATPGPGCLDVVGEKHGGGRERAHRTPAHDALDRGPERGRIAGRAARSVAEHRAEPRDRAPGPSKTSRASAGQRTRTSAIGTSAATAAATRAPVLVPATRSKCRRRGRPRWRSRRARITTGIAPRTPPPSTLRTRKGHPPFGWGGDTSGGLGPLPTGEVRPCA